jgi:hypothetical protein
MAAKRAVYSRFGAVESRFGGAASAQVPDDFVEILDCLPAQIDRQLGYFGNSRFVCFRYEPRAEDVMWTDEKSFGIATGAWQIFHREISSLADLYSVHVGSDKGAGSDVLVYDRVRLAAYFTPRESAEAFLARRRDLVPDVA